jgi:hypothetical protein
MKNVLAVVAAIAITAYAVDRQYYHGYFFKNAGDVSWQVATAFGLRR